MPEQISNSQRHKQGQHHTPHCRSWSRQSIPLSIYTIGIENAGLPGVTSIQRNIFQDLLSESPDIVSEIYSLDKMCSQHHHQHEDFVNNHNSQNPCAGIMLQMFFHSDENVPKNDGVI